jgi:hypothetical protein
MKGLGSVAIAANLAKLVFMGIGMTACAGIEPQACELLEFFPFPGGDPVALGTGYILMSAGQLECCRGMTEFNGRFEGIVAMAIRTCPLECSLVIVGMTGVAAGIQSKIGEFLGFDGPVLDKPCLMTIGALSFCMGAGQTESGQIVVEILLAEAYQLKIPAVVVAVA